MLLRTPLPRGFTWERISWYTRFKTVMLPALIFVAIFVAGCDNLPEYEEPPEITKHEMPELYTAMSEGLSAIVPLTGELDVAVDEKGVMAFIAGERHLRDMKLVDTSGQLRNSVLKLGPQGTQPGSISAVLYGREVLVLTSRDNKLMRFDFSGSQTGRTVTLRDAVRIVGVLRDSLDVLLGTRSSGGEIRFAGVARVPLKGGRATVRIPPSVFPQGEFVAKSDAAIDSVFPLVTSRRTRTAALDKRDGVMRLFGANAEPLGTLGSAQDTGSPGSMFGVYFDGANRLWRIIAEEEKILADVYGDRGMLGSTERPCFRAQAGQMRGAFFAVLCAEKGRVEIAVTPTLFSITD